MEQSSLTTTISSLSSSIKLIIWPNCSKSTSSIPLIINPTTINSIKRLKDLLYSTPLIKSQMLTSSSTQLHMRLYNSLGILLEETDMSNLTNDTIIFLIDTLHQSPSHTVFHPSNHTNQYSFIKWIKSGGFGQVYLAKHYITGDFVAIKQISPDLFSSEDLYNISREKIYLDSLSHKNIIRSQASFYDEENFYIIMDYAKGGELTQYIKNHSPLTEVEVKRIFRQIYNAVLFVHSRNAIHRDLKPNNILFLDEDFQQVVLIDFGICGFSNGNDKESIKAGTTSYIPPEIASGKEYASNAKVDVWSLGVILYYMLYNQLPFTGKNDMEIIDSIITKQVQYPIRKEKISINCLVLMQKMLEKNVHFRIEMNDEAFEDWFSDRRVEGNENVIVKSQLFHSPSPKAKAKIRNGKESENVLIRKCSEKNKNGISVYGKCKDEFKDVGSEGLVIIRKTQTMKSKKNLK